MTRLKLVYRVDPNTDVVKSLDCNATGRLYRKRLLKGTGVNEERWFESEEEARDDYLPHYFSANSAAIAARSHIAQLAKMGVELCATADRFWDTKGTAEIFIKIKKGDYTFQYDIILDN